MLKIEIKKPRKFISPLLSKKSVTTFELDKFEEATIDYMQELESQRIAKQSEPNIVSNALKPYLEKLDYVAQSYSQKGQSGMDLALMLEHSPSVIIEAKVFESSAMIAKGDINKKALHEAVLYFMRERHKGNNTIYHIIITDFYNWFVFDAKDFETLFWKDSTIKKIFDSVKDPSVLGNRTEDFYDLVSSKIADMKANLIDDKVIECAYFDLREKRSEKETIALYKLLSRDTLIKAFNPNDANTLNKVFYSELLYLLGLEEVKSGGKKLIQRAKAQHSGALYENIVQKLVQYGKPTDFESVIRLMIIWINRILFLKLLESQLIKWNGSQEYAFLNADKIKDFDQLETLFFDILAKRPNERGHREFDYVPYLNSSLFEPHAFEQKFLTIATLQDDCMMPYYTKTVLKDAHSKRKEKEVNMLHYLFEFLDAYDFSSEGSEELVNESKSLINASVLGLIFEKLNGYKDGSFYTPSFITMYMSKETITKAIVERFNKTKGWNCVNILDVYNELEDKKEANEIIDSLTICDPAVGSGHFLVSSLNTILEIKSYLKILYDETGMRIRYTLIVENDELIVRDDEGEIFEYKRESKEGTRIQKMLFTQKQKIIENSLFGVDINPNSAQITRLRLWIELLKNSYYADDGQLVTMPNIDINIKVGNSLISRYGLKDEIDIPNIKHAIERYKASVKEYKEGNFLSTKEEIRSAIDDVKGMFGLTLKAQWTQTEEYKKFLGKYVKEHGMDKLKRDMQLDALDFNFRHHSKLFEEELSKAKQKEQAKLLDKVLKAKVAIDEIEQGKIYEDAFEWRFEFPEVLDDEGNFVGFDVVIGNPPYGVKFNVSAKNYFNIAYHARDDIYTLFIEKSFQITNCNGLVDFIVPIFWLTGEKYINTRKLIFNNYYFFKGIILPYNVFEDAYIDTGIFSFQKIATDKIKSYEFNTRDKVDIEILNKISFDTIMDNEWKVTENYKIIFNKFARSLEQKVSKFKLTIGEVTQSTRGILAKNNFYSKMPMGESSLKVFVGKLDRYEISKEYSYIDSLNNIKEKPSEFGIFSNERVLIRRIISRQFRIMATLESDDFINKKDIYIFKSITQDISNKYILSLVNSKFLSFLKTNISTTAKKDDFSQLTLGDIRKLPIPKISKENQQPFIDLADQIIQLKKQNQDTSDLEAKIDVMVYELYGLSDEEVAVVEGRDGV